MYRGSKYCDARELCIQVMRGKTRQLNNQKTKKKKGGVKEIKRGVGVVGLSHIRGTGKRNVEVVEELFEEARVLLTRRTAGSSREFVREKKKTWREKHHFNLFASELDNDAHERWLAETACKPTENRLCGHKITISTS